jgi:prophage regulatory protein
VANSILRLPAVKARTGLSRSTIYLRVQDGSFPRALDLGGGRAVGWLEAEVNAWVDERIAARSREDQEAILSRGPKRSDRAA